MKDVAMLLGGSGEAKLFVLRIEDDLHCAKLELEGYGAEMNYGDCRVKIADLVKVARQLEGKFANIPVKKRTALPANDWRTNQLLSRHLDRPPGVETMTELSLWTIQEDLSCLIVAGERALEEIAGKKNLVEHPIHYFSRRAISTYEGFFKKNPVIQRDSRFVQAIDIMVTRAGILPTNKPRNTYSFLKEASEKNGINRLGFYN
jgi:hypothetical protein